MYFSLHMETNKFIIAARLGFNPVNQVHPAVPSGIDRLGLSSLVLRRWPVIFIVWALVGGATNLLSKFRCCDRCITWILRVSLIQELGLGLGFRF
jgi:hypothetical protein